jgi:Zn-dependent peptidase ImmA (M78 family)
MKTIFDTIREAQQEAPVDVEKLASQLGIKINKLWLDDDMSGSIVRKGDDEFEINVNALHPPTRQRFTIAHELGHFVHHRHLLGDGVNDNRAYRTTSQSAYYNPKIGPKEETEANRFAASLLMPAAKVNELRAGGMTVDQMAERLKVSKHAMSIRIGVPYEA